MRPSRTTTPPAARISSGTERELTRPLAEAQLDENGLPRGADDRLAIDALEAELAAAVGRDERGERLEARAHARVVGFGEDEDPAAAALDVEDGLTAGEDHVRAGGALRALGLAVALGPRQRRAIRLGGIGRGQDHRRRLVLGLLRAQTLDGARQRELRAAEAFDEVAAAADSEGLERAEGVVQEAESAGGALGEHVLARDDPVALEQQLCARAPSERGIRLSAEDGGRQRPAPLHGRARAAAACAESAARPGAV